MSNFNKLRVTLLFVAVVGWLTTLAVRAIFENSYISSHPRVANVSLEEVFPLYVKSIIIYVTEREWRFIEFIRWSQIVSFFVMLVVGVSHWKWPIAEEATE